MKIKTVKPLKKPISTTFDPAENTLFLGRAGRKTRWSRHPILDNEESMCGKRFRRLVLYAEGGLGGVYLSCRCRPDIYGAEACSQESRESYYEEVPLGPFTAVFEAEEPYVVGE
jgi:hypothetical protein